MTLVVTNVLDRFQFFVAFLFGNLKKIDDLFSQFSLVPFQSQHIVRALFDDLCCNRGLTTHRINRYGAACYVEHIEEFRYGRDLVGFGISAELPQRDASPADEGTDHMDCALARATLV